MAAAVKILLFRRNSRWHDFCAGNNFNYWRDSLIRLSAQTDGVAVGCGNQPRNAEEQ
jgi:hypothetical protein